MNRFDKRKALWLAAGLSMVIALPVLSQAGQDEASQRITVPQGFRISTFHQGLNGPRLMVVGPDGNLYVSLTPAGQVVRLPDANRDGRADGVQVVRQGLNKPHGLAWHSEGGNQWLYIAEEGRVTRSRFSNGTFGNAEVLVNDIPTGGRHTTRTVHIGPGDKMYVAVGSGTNKEDEDDPRRAAILRYNLDGSIPSDNPYANNTDARRRPIWAEGLRNSVDFLFTQDGQLWASSHGSDDVRLNPGDPPDLQPYEELVNRVERGRHYGWPYCIPAKLGVNTTNDREIPDPTTNASNPGNFNCATQATPPLFTTVAHAAPIGMTLGTNASNFPAEFRTSVYVGLHGSWNTNNPANYRDCKVERVIVENGLPVRSETFALVRREAGQKCGDAWARPAGVVFGPGGSLYISDDKGGRIFRVSYAAP